MVPTPAGYQTSDIYVASHYPSTEISVQSFEKDKMARYRIELVIITT